MTTTRRGFITGCSAAVAAYAGTSFNTLAFGDPNGDNEEILVSIFLRGGMDGLNLVPVIDGPDRGHYESARPDLAVPLTGQQRSPPLDVAPRDPPGGGHLAGGRPGAARHLLRALPVEQGLGRRGGRHARGQPLPLRLHELHGARDAGDPEHADRLADPSPADRQQHPPGHHHPVAGRRQHRSRTPCAAVSRPST